MAKVLSMEDKDLGTIPSVTLRTRSYTDLDLSFTTKPNFGSGLKTDVYKKFDADAVKQSVKNLILTNHFEKPFDPYFGGNISRLFFELADDLTESEVEDDIKYAIETFEPRVEILNIFATIDPDTNSCTARVVFKVISTNTVTTLETDIARLR